MLAKKIIIPLLLLFLIAGAAKIEADINISASVDRNVVSLGEQLVLSLTISGDVANIPAPTVPQITGFNIYSAGQSHSISFINGRVSSSLTYNYVLVPQSAGKFTIPPFVINIGGKTYQTEPIEIEVTQATQQQQQLPPTPSPQQQKKLQKFAKGDNRQARVFLKASLDKTKAYVGEQITLTVQFFYSTNLLSQPQYSPPQISGFWVEDLPPPKNYTTVYQGRRYGVVELKTALFPTSPGRYIIGSASVKCAIEDFSIDDFFDEDFFDKFFSRGREIEVKSEPLEVTILPLPSENKPQDFSGAVGQYKISANVDKYKLHAGEPLTLNVVVSGKGNVKTIGEIKMPEVIGLKKYETVSAINVSKQNYVLQGSKTFRTVYIPQVSGKFTIPAVKFSYFDPQDKVYKTLATETFTIESLPGTTTASTQQPPSITKSTSQLQEKFVTSDIRHIKLSSALYTTSLPMNSTLFPYILFLPYLLPLALWQYKIYQENLNRDVSRVRSTKAYKIAKKRLILLKKNKNIKDDDFYSEIYDIFVNYLGDKFNLPSASITVNDIERKISSYNVENSIVEEVRNLWYELDFMRFAPSAATATSLTSENRSKKREEIYGKLEALLTALEKKL
jgi:hypothetical protein